MSSPSVDFSDAEWWWPEGDGWRSDLGARFAWRAALSPGFLVDAPRLHPCIGFGEHVILADTPSDLLLRNQDWKAPACVAKHPLLGRGNLLPSDLPRFTGKKFAARHRGVHEGWQIWDFGGEVFGFLNLDVETDEAGTCTLLHGESLARNGLPDFSFSGGDFRDILELPVGRRCWESFEKRALRYLAMPDRFCVRGLSVRESHRPLVEIWRASPTVEKLNAVDRAIIEAAARTVTLCCDDLLNLKTANGRQ